MMTFVTNLIQPDTTYQEISKLAQDLDQLNDKFQIGYPQNYFSNQIKHNLKSISELNTLLKKLPAATNLNDTNSIEIINLEPVLKLRNDAQRNRQKRGTQKIISGGQEFENINELIKRYNLVGC